MTPAARVAAAIEVIDEIVAGRPAEQVLTRWGRQNRYAGSKDRAAVRDHVFECLRQWRLAAHLGGGEDGRARMIGLMRAQGIAPETLFTGDRHAPDVLRPEEASHPDPAPSKGEIWNLPDWLLPEFERSLGPNAETTALCLQRRAPVVVRVNTQKTTAPDALVSLAQDGIEAVRNSISETALTVVNGERKVRQSQAYQTGCVELQDASSQEVVARLPQARKPLDYCAGGGGKALAMAAHYGVPVFAHDRDQNRMADIPARARRANAKIQCLATGKVESHAPFDLVLCDAPCSGSGAWRRAPEGKWALTQTVLEQTLALQDHILDAASSLVAPGGTLAYATCSVLRCENEDRIDAFLKRHPDWSVRQQFRLDVSADGDGFFSVHLTID